MLYFLLDKLNFRPVFPTHSLLLETMYKPAVNRQPTFDDFNQSCGMQPDPRNEWCILAGKIDWSAAETRYATCFKSGKGPRRREAGDETERIEGGRSFSREKRICGAACHLADIYFGA